jgi:CDP-ribitol ribitolphosphotransferase / teichoic acid ribitol-phosphate polymerase
MVKTFGYYLFALVYLLCKPFPIKPKKVLCIMTHDDGEGSNVSIVARALRDLQNGYTFSYITKSDTQLVKSFSGIRTFLQFFFQKPYELATSEIILLDNIFLPMAYLRMKKAVKVIQLWHGTGTIKKFGQDFNSGKLKELEQRANKQVTHLIVNSQEMKKLYSGAFGIPRELIYPIGLPKTDELLLRYHKRKENTNNPERDYIFQKYHIPQDKKLILYAPTFRDQEALHPKVMEQLEEILPKLPEEYYLGLRLHPFVANAFHQKQLGSRVCQLSFEKDLTALLLAADLLITDYSSIIFEYCLTERPMIFYAYDYEAFSDHGRGFYYDYINYVPGPVAFTGNEVIEILQENKFDQNKIAEFKKKSFDRLDGKATERLISLIE